MLGCNVSDLVGTWLTEEVFLADPQCGFSLLPLTLMSASSVNTIAY